VALPLAETIMTMTNQTQHSSASGMSQRMTLLFTIAAGSAVANLYWAQPLLKYIGDAFGVSTSKAGLLVTVSQIGYAIGIFLIVPLGDTLNRRRLIPAVMASSAVALGVSAVAPGFGALLVALTLVGLTTLTGQLLLPMAGDLALDAQRGRVVGTIASGTLTGIVLSRMISGFLADAFGWRAVFVVAALGAVLLTVLLARSLPELPPRPAVPYRKLLGSVFAVVRQYREVQVILVIGNISFAVFTMFWTGLTFLLSSPPFSYSATQIGLVSFVGLVGTLAAQRAGRLHDRGWSAPATTWALVLTLVALGVAGLGSTSIVLILIGTILFQATIQAVNVLNQIRLFAVDPSARSRLNTAFVTGNFIGGAIGSALAGFLWQFGRWPAVTGAGAALVAVALLVWLVHKAATR
jgi:predicted MFS family arabinose efflux permease